MAQFQRREVFCERAIRGGGIAERGGWRLKRYDISIGGASVPDEDYREGEALALAALPHPAVNLNRPGVGVLIRHPGRGWHYVVVAWWDNQNELLNRVFVRDLAAGTPWRDSGGAFSFCVWDLEVLWHERCAFVKHVMTPPGGPDFGGYLNDVMRAPGR